MSAIIRHALNMLPYMALALPVYLIARACYVKSKGVKIIWRRELLLLIFAVFAVGLASQTVIPKFETGVNGFSIVKERIHETNLLPFTVVIETYNEVFINGNLAYFLINFLGNVVLFVPFGLFTQLLWDIPKRKSLLIGLGASLFIEFCQLFLARGTDVDDLLLNTAGTCLGLLIFALFKKICPKFALSFRNK